MGAKKGLSPRSSSPVAGFAKGRFRPVHFIWLLLLGMFFLSKHCIIFLGEINDVCYGKSFSMQPRAKNSIDHEHALDCAALNTENDPGIDVKVHNSCVAPEFKMNVHPTGDLVSRFIRSWGCFECSLVKKFMRFLAQTPPDTFLLDMGANMGWYSLHAAALGRDVFAFEPFQKNYQRICKSTTILNKGFDDRIVVFNVALTDHPTTIGFGYVSEKNFGGIHVEESDAVKTKAADAVRGVDYAPGIQLSSLKDVLPTNRPAVIKIDVERAECEALGGALDYLHTIDLLYVQIEWNPAPMGACKHRDAIFELFRKNRLTPYQHYPIQDVWKPLDVKEYSQWHNSWLIEKVGNYPFIDIAWIRE
ncbi:Inherit from COG: Methyltransferase [Seminavis robusta]|uniref:Inherit from COG: Methyltransferase n=1 Tax=Seminavis robusta TaxID=568900 RepID=A0A9N8DUR1_9STRA|nr:Inherit from COG: Methyltransferase [Seminavis robusta]|eukprot:Sro356_g125470.1 Inherit from COG: Methyltransferase (361) ;mRNA; f:67542-68624